MAEPARSGNGRVITPRPGAFGTAAVTARQQFAWLWSRESLLRLALAFVLATALWLYVADRQSPSQVWDYPTPLGINVEGLPPGLTVTNILPPVRVRLRANRNTTAVTQSSFHPFVDLSRYQKGVHYVKVNVAPDPGIQVLQVTPAQVRVALDVQVQTHVPVRWHLFSPPPSGYAAGSITVDPSTVLVSGPKADVSQVTQVLVYIDLSGIRSSVQGVYPAFPVDSRGTTVASHLVSVSPTQVRVTVPISSPSRYRTLPIVPAVTGQPKGGLGVVSMVTSPSNVTVYGAPPQLSHAGSLLTAPISIAGRGAGTFKQTAKLRAPRGVQLSTYRATVTVTIGAVNSSTSTEVQLVALNSPPGLLVQLRPSRVLVTAVGSPRALQTTAGQIQAVLNLAGFGAGTYKLQPSLRLPAGLNLVSAYPSQITVVLTPSR